MRITQKMLEEKRAEEARFHELVENLERRRTAARVMLAALQGIQQWATMMGGWESPKWEAVDAAVRQAEEAGITPLSKPR